MERSVLFGGTGECTTSRGHSGQYSSLRERVELILILDEVEARRCKARHRYSFWSSEFSALSRSLYAF